MFGIWNLIYWLIRKSERASVHAQLKWWDTEFSLHPSHLHAEDIATTREGKTYLQEMGLFKARILSLQSVLCLLSLLWLRLCILTTSCPFLMQESFLLPLLSLYIRPWVAGKEVIYSWNLHIFFKEGYSIKQSNACQYRAHWNELKTSQWLIQA